MSTEPTSQTILDREYLPVRAKILQIAASLDRIQRAPGDATQDGRVEQVRTAIEKLLANEPDRARQIQLLFSRSYDPQWRDTLGLAR